MSGRETGPLLSIRNLRTWFETNGGMVYAVNDISLDLAVGESLGIVGESGSGKTQCFFSVFGLTDGYPGVVGGSARFEDIELLEGLKDHVEMAEAPERSPKPGVWKDEHRWNRLHRERASRILGHSVGFIFQEVRRSLVPYWSVRKHLNEILHRKNRPESDAEEVLFRLGFRSPRRILDAYPGELSGGEAQRAMMALALAIEPRLLIADEPTTALDALSQGRLLAELERIHDEMGLALVLISHDLSVVNHVVDQVAVLFGGRLVEFLTRRRLDEAPASELHPYTQELKESQARRQGSLGLAPAREGEWAPPAPEGCAYAGRCLLRPGLSPELKERCRFESPPLQPVAVGQETACWGMGS